MVVFELDDKLISEEILTVRFRCDIARCKGMCCVEGDGGAPLELDEAELLEAEYAVYKPFMKPEGIAAVKREGFFTIDDDGELVTPLVGGRECAYSYKEGDVTLCAIEKAFVEGRTTFRKPISCHLYPIRLIRFSDGRIGLNYHCWEICASARECGERDATPLYESLHEALVRRFGEEFYQELEELVVNGEQVVGATLAVAGFNGKRLTVVGATLAVAQPAGADLQSVPQ